MKKIIFSLVLVTLFISPAYAQIPPVNLTPQAKAVLIAELKIKLNELLNQLILLLTAQLSQQQQANQQLQQLVTNTNQQNQNLAQIASTTAEQNQRLAQIVQNTTPPPPPPPPQTPPPVPPTITVDTSCVVINGLNRPEVHIFATAGESRYGQLGSQPWQYGEFRSTGVTGKGVFNMAWNQYGNGGGTTINPEPDTYPYTVKLYVSLGPPNLGAMVAETSGILTVADCLDIQPPTPQPYFSPDITFDKTVIGNNGTDSIKVVIATKDSTGRILPNKNVTVTTYKTEEFTSDANGIINMSFTTTQGGVGEKLTVSADGYSKSKTYNVVSTSGSATAHIALGSDRIVAPAKNQLFGVIMIWKFLSITNLKVTSLKLRLTNLDQSWFENFRITNSVPCTIGRQCTFNTFAPPANNTFENGVVTIIPTTPIDIYDNNTYLYIIADTKDPTSRNAAGILTNFSMRIDDGDLLVTGKVQGYDPSTITFYGSGYINNKEIRGNYCTDGGTQIVTCF